MRRNYLRNCAKLQLMTPTSQTLSLKDIIKLKLMRCCKFKLKSLKFIVDALVQQLQNVVI